MTAKNFIRDGLLKGICVLASAGAITMSAPCGGLMGLCSYADVSTTGDYENIAIARVTDYVNVRAEANTSSEALGKIYNNCAASILETVDGEGGQWYHIRSGSLEGYIKAEYFITGDEAEQIASEGRLGVRKAVRGDHLNIGVRHVGRGVPAEVARRGGVL